MIEKVDNESNDWPTYLNGLGKTHLIPKSERKVYVNDEMKFKNCDPFGNSKDRFKKQKPKFRLHPPNAGLRYETNRMVVLPEAPRKERKFYSIFNKMGKRKKHCIKRLDW